MGIYITSGTSLLPDGLSVDDIIHGRIPDVHLPADPSHLPNILGERCIDETAFAMPRMDKIVRRVANAQSRWVLYTGIKTWENSIGDRFSPEQRGLFIGLGTSDADDSSTPIAFDAKDDEDYVVKALVETPPLMGLTLLNTSTASHLSQHLDITGDNGFFSPHVDAGGNALLEGYYSIKEKRSQFVLCGGGSQKISTWYYLAYENLIKGVPWIPAEAASFITLHEDSHHADSEISQVFRTLLLHRDHVGRLLAWMSGEKMSEEKVSEENSSPAQIIHVGKITDEFTAQVYDTFPSAAQFNLDKALGYCGSAAPFVAINLAIEIHKKGTAIDNVSRNARSQHSSGLTWILVHGLENQCTAILLRMGMLNGGEQ
ncbi:hypothetical protein AB204_17645 [Xenorhabdus khoisanae]|uniref:Beta-ketoacyl synthase N-terminal domain-containing protein n=1 Tax=Xenorhabdus khoisanae TaxID=880157 RepID=A0A0J5FPE8_9GAMM|nr:hypothetical protein [Xenorhabdus khoisanae]KMJ43827.1 hypothetical protein AB204_17645 [Xenorhabdus khoisanae]